MAVCQKASRNAEANDSRVGAYSCNKSFHASASSFGFRRFDHEQVEKARREPSSTEEGERSGAWPCSYDHRPGKNNRLSYAFVLLEATFFELLIKC